MMKTGNCVLLFMGWLFASVMMSDAFSPSCRRYSVGNQQKDVSFSKLRQSTRTHLLLDPNLASSLLLASEVEPNFVGDITYSKASYYTVLGLYLLSFPGLWSTIKRSTKAKVKRITYVSDGEAVEGGKNLRQQAGEIMAYMKANNYEVLEAGETITFRGIVQRSKSQAFFLVFCTAIGLASLALVLQIQFQDFELFGAKPNWFLLTFLSPYAGLYYWQSGDRVDDCSVKLESNDEETQNEITVQGPEEELDRMWRTLEWQEKGKVKVPGLLDQI